MPNRRKDRQKVREAFAAMEQTVQTFRASVAPLQTYAKNIAASGRQVSAATEQVKKETGASFIKRGVALSSIPLTLGKGETVYPRGVVAAATNPITYAVDPAGKLQAPKHFGGRLLPTVRHEVAHLLGKQATGEFTTHPAIRAASIDVPSKPGKPIVSSPHEPILAQWTDVMAGAGLKSAQRRLARFKD